MSRTGVLAVVAATGVVVTAVPVTLLSSNSYKSESEEKPFIPRISSAKEIRTKYEEVKCLKNYFEKITFNGRKTQNPQFSQIDNFSSNSESCLIVEYYKQTYKNGYWKGEFRLIWAIKDKSKGQGLITTTNVRTRDDGRLWGNSTAYTLKKDNQKNSWTTVHIQEIDESRKTKEALGRLIPQKSSTLPGSLKETDYWGFNPDLDKICNSNCKEDNNPETRNSYSWEFSGDSGENAVHSWTSNINNWWTTIFAWGEFAKKIQEVKGKWKEK